jgi:hypothetical protein
MEERISRRTVLPSRLSSSIPTTSFTIGKIDLGTRSHQSQFHYCVTETPSIEVDRPFLVGISPETFPPTYVLLVARSEVFITPSFKMASRAVRSFVE